SVVEIEVGSTTPKNYPNRINLAGNLGHVGDLIHGAKPHKICGWGASVCALAMIAYCAELDFIYKEQDCLAFGPCVSQMYQAMGDANMVFGRRMTTKPNMPCAQSLFLIRHKFIPNFVADYLSLGDESDKANTPEAKFVKIESLHPGKVRRLSFGYDRE